MASPGKGIEERIFTSGVLLAEGVLFVGSSALASGELLMADLLLASGAVPLLSAFLKASSDSLKGSERRKKPAILPSPVTH